MKTSQVIWLILFFIVSSAISAQEHQHNSQANIEKNKSKMEDKIDPKAGIIFYPKIGSKIKKGELIAELFTDKKDKIEIAKRKILDAIKISTRNETGKLKLIKKIIR